jgi:pyrimidine operon attenuation protein / uracil phosphoribosyltransferase
MKNNNCKLLMDEKALNDAIEKLSCEIAEDFGNDPDFAIIGIRTRGVIIAQRLRKIIGEKTGKIAEIGILDITLYRDDLSTLAEHPIVRPSALPFDVDGKKIILVDDVIYTGRTIRAALDQIVDYGRPAQVKLVAFVDRGWREYPIQPDYTALKIETTNDQIVQVRLSEIDGDEKVTLLKIAT